MQNLTPVLAALLAACAAATAHAGVVRLDIDTRAPIPASSPTAIRYERLTGTYYGELDPDDAHNSLITDIALAPRNARGRVEYSATFEIARPIDPKTATGVMFYDVPNRGYGVANADEHGHIHVVSGWQGDVLPAPDRQTATVPIAHNPDGSRLTGPALARFVDIEQASSTTPLLAGIGIPVPRPLPASTETIKATLIHYHSDSEPGEIVPPSDWAFANCNVAPFPGAGDPRFLCLKGRFAASSAYDLLYTAKDPRVLGIGFAAARDFVAFLRYGAGTGDAPNPIAGQVKKTIGTGVSQSGNFLRSFIELGFNTAEDGRIVLDGANPRVAARLVPLNVRFGVPGGGANAYEAGSEGVLWWGRYDDTERGRGKHSLLDRCSENHTCPKIVETFGSSEFWGYRMSADLVGVDAKADIPLPANVRRYYSPGVTHGGGPGGFPTEPPPKVPGCELAANPNPSSHTTRALTEALVAWVVHGKEPPASRYPTLQAGDLVAPTREAMGFPDIAGQPSPDHKINAFLLYDFGPAFDADHLSGVMTVLPPKTLREAPSLVPRVDADGNEQSGIPSVQMRVPLGTYLGWNVKATGYYRGAGCGFQGGFIPFARTAAERLAVGDPRPSLAERYGTHAAFVEKVRAAAAQLVKDRFLLDSDARAIVQQAENSEVLVD